MLFQDHLQFGNDIFFWNGNIEVAAMPDSKVRALCAQIAIELDPEKVDALIAELTKLLYGEYAAMKAKAAEELDRGDVPRKPN